VGTAPARPARTAPCSAANTYKRRKPTAAPALSPAGALAVPPSRLDGAQRHGDHAIVPVHACAHDAAPTPASATLRRAALPRPRWGAGARDPHARRPCKRSKPSAVHPLLQCLLQAARPTPIQDLRAGSKPHTRHAAPAATQRCQPNRPLGAPVWARQAPEQVWHRTPGQARPPTQAAMREAGRKWRDAADRCCLPCNLNLPYPNLIRSHAATRRAGSSWPAGAAGSAARRAARA